MRSDESRPECLLNWNLWVRDSVSGALSEGAYTVKEGPGTYYFVFSGEYMDYFWVKVYDWR
ncbi:hypothetical protein AKJ36_00930 [candidate division MSBL1 archaeon SCGC-AAA259I07]|uniref:Uncharacterized protein n=1 Tax=candidate division MSBL1 archaeon SCGC-AAA259I07 TaxID=1698266 RepID=A0A133UM86_9EURY|nr:hypothetical protein AKJ36_00930 [candidate division MSBL1 archaeon SCGC-AAA259I07]